MGLTYFDYFLESCDPELVQILEADKEGVFKDNYIIRDELQNKFVHNILADENSRDKIIEFTGMFMDEHSAQLSTAGPVYSFTFGDKETSFFYNLFGVTPELMIDIFNKVVAETYFGSISKFFPGWVNNAPHKILITSILIDALQNSYDDIVECCEYIWAFCEYPIVFRDYWKIGVKEDVMAYTMEHLGAKYKFIQKKMKTLKELLKYHAEISVSSQAQRLITGADNTYFDFMQRMRNQIKNSFKNISREYYDNYEKNNTLHKKDNTFDDGKIAEQEGHTTNMSNMVDNTINKFSVDWINNSLIGAAANASQVDKSILTGYINQIFGTKKNRTGEFIEGVITAYFDKYPSAGSNLSKSEFLSFGLALYRSLNSAQYNTMRSILDFWMYDIINIKNVYKSPGTIVNYTRAIFNYIIFMIAHYN